MSNEELEAQRPELLAMTNDEVSAPSIPMAVFLQEANDLHTLIQDETIWAQLAQVGVAEAQRGRLATGIAAARAAQSAWVVLRDRSKSEQIASREQQAYDLRTGILAAARWNLRNDRVARGILSAISEGEGVADLSQDLSDLAVLLRSRLAAFVADQTFDAEAKADAAQQMAEALADSTSLARFDNQQRDAKELRDRAYTRLDELIVSLREAGRYAFRDQPRVQVRFASDYRRKRRRNRATGESAVESDGPVA